MSVSKWAYLPERCDGDVCVGDCDLCSKAEENVALMEGDGDTISRHEENEKGKIDKLDVLTWLLHYHKLSFDLHGRYLPHEVIGWLVADISKNLLNIADLPHACGKEN